MRPLHMARARLSRKSVALGLPVLCLLSAFLVILTCAVLLLANRLGSLIAYRQVEAATLFYCLLAIGLTSAMWSSMMFM